MPENEFEKKVSSEMHELKFKPSEQVWEKVEERIRKKKDRRILIIIFLFAGLALLGYWQWNNLFGEKKNEIVKAEEPNNDNNKQSTQQKTEIKRADQPQANDQHSKLNGQQQSTDDSKQNEIVNKHSDKTDTETLKNFTAEGSKERTSVINDKTTKDKNREQQKRSNQSAAPKRQKSAAVVVISGDDKPVVEANNEKQIRQEQTKQEQIKQEGTEVEPSERRIDSAKSEVVKPKTDAETKKDTTSKKGSVKDSAAAVVQKKSPQKKWKWGLQFTPGISSLNDQNFSLGAAQAADMAFQTPVSSGGTPRPQPASPSEHKGGFAFKLGGFIQGQISKKSQIVFGLQYAYYSEKIDVGNKIGQSGPTLSYATNLNSSYAAATPYQKVTNSYHFIEATANYQLRLNKNQTKPFTWNLGLNFGQLIGTNAVMYDTASGGIYYKNTDYLNKTQFSLLTGFSWTVSNNNRMQWTLGPTIDIHLSSLLDNPFENKKYLFFAGLRSAVILNSRK